MLRIENLTVSYGPRRVLHSVSLDVQSGEVVALIGPNGAGKSTLVRVASGIVPAEVGIVRTNGDDLLTLPSMQRARHLAVVPQAVSMPAAFTVWETVLLGRTPYLNFLGQVSAADEAIACRALAKVDALELAGRRVGELSGGEQQRVLLARALAQATPILLLDEPTSNLDLHYQVSFMETIQALARQDDLAVLIALHDLNLAARFADRLVLLVDGEVKASGTPQQVLTPELISVAYNLPVQVVPHPFEDALLVLPASPASPRRR
ncbi:MAG: heme ABC transporter ATP-binding protein [Anaerolineales bacterium]|nr:heme ABC transporter ATP-binding protein [Anaerolineales bacterium]